MFAALKETDFNSTAPIITHLKVQGNVPVKIIQQEKSNPGTTISKKEYKQIPISGFS
jgi:hypothetical protein